MFKPTSGSPAPSKAPATPITENTPGVMDLFQGLSTSPAPKETTQVAKPTSKGQDRASESLEPEETDSPATESADTETEASETDAAATEGGAEEGASDGNADNVLEVKARGKMISYKLDKNDKKLQQALSWGAIGPDLAAEKNEYKKKFEAASTQLASQGEGHGKFSEAMEMAKEGYVESAVKEILGEELYKKFFNESVIARIDYENATPEQRIDIINARHAKEKAELNWKLQRGKDGKDKGAALSKEAAAKAKEVELEGYAKSAISKHDFAALDDNRAAQETYKVKVYKMAMDDLHTWLEEKNDPSLTLSQAQIEKAIARNYNLLTGAGGRGKNSGTAKATSSASGNKQAAAKTAAKNYDKGKVEGFENLSPLAALAKLQGR